ncbi:TPA: peptidoglycan D,D-transpeptidase FtsI family protein [Bacillus cereus]|uniref:serine-type D-Ala-D-Ala carboxypeptidase n=7 Tax=Bacillus cereus group TaxID=86661 RepID=A0AAN0SYE2_BACCE|nr:MULTISPECIES: penicillin-binding protein 2 [Bacillus cereus group]ABK85665.1 cell elongation-specific peptidoglycan D,D-transpeptidase [Bacillus thuringiensis str. Al Hakam]ACO28026.1 penicillin-binding protein [Bacillus cereus 03BB102]AJG52004.1 penicillin binding transpeptidase domain protein [Bacillus cereus 03BB102]AJH70788.1 penicillin binding transpeptidase domain protein [Bacillus thuringiensis]AJI12307.1 penicillin binding transpeptidase domain protein [Bacillus cereus 03BB108]
MKKQEKKSGRAVTMRLNILFFCVFILFSAMIIQLGKVQIIDGETYKNEVEKRENATVSLSVPRGKIFDREGNPVVDNRSLRTITYTKMKGVKSEEILKTARQLADIIEIPQEDIDKLTETDKKDFWMQLNPTLTEKLVSKKEINKFRDKDITGKNLDKKIEELKRKRVTDKNLQDLTDKDIKVLAIKSKMTSGYQMAPQIIKKDVSEKEFTIISEGLANLPGVDVSVDWERVYVNDGLFRSVLGNVSNSDEGLPSERLDYYLVRDYSRNDRVGKSYIEQQYEDVLHGTKKEVRSVADKQGTTIRTETISEGKSGKNLTLTIDMELQKKVEESIEKILKAYKGSESMLDRAFVVMMNPKNGQVLSMAGKRLVEKDGKTEIEDYALGTMTSSYELGSTVKGATVLTGFETKAITPGTYFYDAPMKFKGTREKKSWKEFGNIDDLRALQVSSNVYMFHTALKIAGVDYVRNSSLNIKQEYFDKMRYYFRQFGLGVPTGIDLPNETAGQIGKKDNQPGFLLDYSIGQYDTYTPLQLVQYISTIANGGYRMKPQIVQEVREQTSQKDEIGKVVHAVEPIVLNKVDMKEEYIKQVKEGFRKVFQEGDGTGVRAFQKASYKPAGKTGTAQTVYGGESDIGRNEKGERRECYNLTLAGYAPYDNPEVAFSVVVPWVMNDKSGINSDIGKEVLDAYFELKNKRLTGETLQIDSSQEG